MRAVFHYFLHCCGNKNQKYPCKYPLLTFSILNFSFLPFLLLSHQTFPVSLMSIFICSFYFYLYGNCLCIAIKIHIDNLEFSSFSLFLSSLFILFSSEFLAVITPFPNILFRFVSLTLQRDAFDELFSFLTTKFRVVTYHRLIFSFSFLGLSVTE